MFLYANPEMVDMVDVCFQCIKGKRIAKQPGFGTRISKVSGRLTGGPLNMTTARCPKMDDETVPIQGVLPPNCSQVVTFEDWMMGHPPS